MKEIADHKPHEQFQVERIALFSDAVFAIAITLLILEIRVPEIDKEVLSDRLLGQELWKVAPRFVSFLLSFYVIGTYWLSHHRMFYYVRRCSSALLRNNLLFLLPIVIMPFGSSYISSYFNGVVRLPIVLYTVNIGLAGFFNYRLWRIITDPKHDISIGVNRAVLQYNTVRALAIPVVFTTILLLSFINISLAYLVLPLTFFAGVAIKRYFIRKHPLLVKMHVE